MSLTQVVPMQLDDGTIFYVEAQEGLASTTISTLDAEEEEEVQRGGAKGVREAFKSIAPAVKVPTPAQSMQIMQRTIRAYAGYSLSAFKNFGAANVDEVTLEFGINFSADAGVPYIANGKAQSSLKITVKCSYNSQSSEPLPEQGASAANAGSLPNGNGGAKVERVEA